MITELDATRLGAIGKVLTWNEYRKQRANNKAIRQGTRDVDALPYPDTYRLVEYLTFS